MTYATTLYLERIDVGRNMARFYVLDVETDLLGDVVTIRRWGRIGSSARQILKPFPTMADAQRHLDRYATLKRRRGYCEPQD